MHKNNILSYLINHFTNKDLLKINLQSSPIEIKEKFLKQIKHYNLVDALMEIGILYKYMLKEYSDEDMCVFAYNYCDDKFEYIFRTDILLMIAHFFIISGANKNGKQEIKQNSMINLIYLSEIAKNIQHSDIKTTPETLYNHMCMYYKEQILHQGNIKNKICQNYLIYKDKYSQKIKEITGLEYDDYFRESFALIILLSRFLPPLFSQKQAEKIINEMPNKYYSNNSMMRLIDFLSISIDKYKKLQKQDNYKNIMLLQYKPIIKEVLYGKNVYICPLPILLIENLFNGLYYIIESSYKNKLEFRTEFGLVFEKYIGNILVDNKSNYQIIPESEISYRKNNNDAKFVDWTVLNDELAYIIEVKSAMLPLTNIYNTNINDFLAKHFVEDYKQMLSHINDINSCEELAFLRDKKIYPIIIYKDIPLINSCLFKDVVIKYLEQNDRNQDILNAVKNNLIYLFNFDDFQFFWMNEKNISITDLFDKLNSQQQESISSIIQKLPDYKYETTCWDDIIDKIMPIK